MGKPGLSLQDVYRQLMSELMLTKQTGREELEQNLQRSCLSLQPADVPAGRGDRPWGKVSTRRPGQLTASEKQQQHSTGTGWWKHADLDQHSSGEDTWTGGWRTESKRTRTFQVCCSCWAEGGVRVGGVRFNHHEDSKASVEVTLIQPPGAVTFPSHTCTCTHAGGASEVSQRILDLSQCPLTMTHSRPGTVRVREP